MALTKRQLEVLRIMQDEDEELVYEGGVGFVGYERVSAKTLLALLRHCVISIEDSGGDGKLERYYLNGTGRQVLKGDYSECNKVMIRVFGQ